MKRTIGGFDEVTLSAVKAVEKICRFVISESTVLRAIHSINLNDEVAYKHFIIEGTFFQKKHDVYFETSFTLRYQVDTWEISDNVICFRPGSSIDGDGVNLRVKGKSLIPNSELDAQKIQRFRKWLKI